MMRAIFYSTGLILLLFSFSCRSYVSSGHAVYPDISFSAKANVEVDVEVDTTRILEAKSTTTVVFRIFKSSDNKFSDVYSGLFGDKEKKAAIYKALDGTNYDMIFNPKFKVEYYRGLFVRKTTCTVKGYGARYIYKTKYGVVNDFNFNEKRTGTPEAKIISNPRQVLNSSAKNISFIWNGEKYIGEILKEEPESVLVRVSINGVVRELNVPKANIIP
jgi:hypothetical protein